MAFAGERGLLLVRKAAARATLHGRGLIELADANQTKSPVSSKA
jgi:hypothetical protein